jgi:hypothetical protein
MVRLQLIAELVDGASTLDFMLEDFIPRFSHPTRKSTVNSPARLANDQRLTSSTICEISFERARHDFHRTLYILCELRAVDPVLA